MVADRQAIDDAIAALPEEFRVALVMREMEGRSYQEIAEALGIELGTVKFAHQTSERTTRRAAWRHSSVTRSLRRVCGRAERYSSRSTHRRRCEAV